MGKWFLIVARLEGLSFLALLLAMPVKYLLSMPQAVQILGPVHGCLFLLYVFLGLLTANEESWSLKKQFLALVASVTPFGFFVFERKFYTNVARKKFL